MANELQVLVGKFQYGEQEQVTQPALHAGAANPKSKTIALAMRGAPVYPSVDSSLEAR